MLHLRSSNGVQNLFSIDVYSTRVSSSINCTDVLSPNAQYTPNSNMNTAFATYYVELIEQATQKKYFSQLGEIYAEDNFPRSKQFFLYLDDITQTFHLNLTSEGLYDYKVFYGSYGATSSDSQLITLEVNRGMALVHNDNFVNDHYQNSQSGVTQVDIPATISYNG